jgi:peptidyl-prolyl cis-trans isomerase C
LRRFAPLSALLALSLAACEPPPPPLPGTVAPGGVVVSTVNGNAVTQDMVDATLKQLPENLRQQLETSGQLSQVKEQVVIGELLYREALKAKLHESSDTKLSLALVQRNALADAQLAKIVEQRADAARIQKWYDDHAVQYKRVQAKVRLIALPSVEAAAEVKAALDAGGDFAKLAAEKSQDARSKDKGGEIGWVSERDMPPQFGGPVFAAPQGGVVGPIEAGGSQLFFKIDEKRDAVPLDEVKDEIKEQLRQEVIQEYIEELKKGATIVDGAGGATVTSPPAGGAVAPGAPAAPAAPAAGAPAAPAAPAAH